MSRIGRAVLLGAVFIAAGPVAAGVVGGNSSTSPVRAEYVGFDERIDVSRWSRYDFALINHSTERQTLKLCPTDSALLLNSHRRDEVSGFAVKFDTEAWSFNCSARDLEPGERVTLGVFFRPAFAFESRIAADSFDVVIVTNLGNYVMTAPLNCDSCTDRYVPREGFGEVTVQPVA